jgi:hypothetical protein
VNPLPRRRDWGLARRFRNFDLKGSAMRLASTLITSLLATATLAGPLSAQRVPGVKPVYTAILAAPNVQLTPRCEVKNIWNNMQKIWVPTQTGKVVFKMAVTGPPSGLMVSDSNFAVELPVANGQDTPPIEPGSEILDFHAPGFGALPFGAVVGNQFASLGSAGSLYYVWNWPTGTTWVRFGPMRWAANKCNNVPVPPITALQMNPWIKEINKGLIVETPVGPGGLGTGTLGTGSASQNEQIKNRF